MGIIFWTCPPNTAPGEKLRVDIFPSTIPSLQHELRGIPAARLCSCKGCPRLVQFSPRESGLFLRQEGSRTQSVRGLTPAHQPTATAGRGKAPQAEGHWGTCGMRREQKQGCIHAPSPTPFQESIPVLVQHPHHGHTHPHSRSHTPHLAPPRGRRGRGVGAPRPRCR